VDVGPVVVSDDFIVPEVETSVEISVVPELAVDVEAVEVFCVVREALVSAERVEMLLSVVVEAPLVVVEVSWDVSELILVVVGWLIVTVVETEPDVETEDIVKVPEDVALVLVDVSWEVTVDDFSVLVQTVDSVEVLERVDEVVSEFHTGLWVVVVLALVVEEVSVVVLVDSVTGTG
jgi:hypothetical protein